MGFDPRQWSPASKPSQRQRVTSNVESLLVENDALRHEVRRLRAELQRLRTHQFREIGIRQANRLMTRQLTSFTNYGVSN
jgi:uncharacterized protein YjiS (DUF1127 family)